MTDNDQKDVSFKCKCRICGLEKLAGEMVTQNGLPTKLCRKCRSIIYDRKKYLNRGPKKLKEKRVIVKKEPLPKEIITPYTAILKDSQGFIRDLKHKPSKYELVTLKTKCGRDLSGWWEGSEWYSRGFRSYDNIVVGWKRKSSLRG